MAVVEDLGPHENTDLGPHHDADLDSGGTPADPELFDDEVERYFRLARRARTVWCPCQWADSYSSEEECLDHAPGSRECFYAAVAGPPKNEDLAALRCFNDTAERVYFPCVEMLTGCMGLRDCGMNLARELIEWCDLTEAVAMCFSATG